MCNFLPNIPVCLLLKRRAIKWLSTLNDCGQEAEKTAKKKKLICYTRFTLKLLHKGKGDVHVVWRRQNNISFDVAC